MSSKLKREVNTKGIQEKMLEALALWRRKGILVKMLEALALWKRLQAKVNQSLKYPRRSVQAKRRQEGVLNLRLLKISRIRKKLKVRDKIKDQVKAKNRAEEREKDRLEDKIRDRVKMTRVHLKNRYLFKILPWRM